MDEAKFKEVLKKALIQSNQELIDNCKFDELYEKFNREEAPYLTAVLLKSGINPLPHMSSVVNCMYQGLDILDINEIVIPANISRIGRDAFCGCAQLENIIVDAGNDEYKSIDGNLYSIDGKTLIQYAIGKKEKEFIIPEGVEYIGRGAFANSVNLEKITIPEGIYLADRAFFGCHSLKKVIIADNATEITMGSYVFSECSALEEVYVGENVSFDINAFSKCVSLKKVTLNKTMAIAGGQFAGCSSLPEIVLPEGLKSIGQDAFDDCGQLTKIVVPDIVEEIYGGVFDFCPKLKYYEYEGGYYLGNDANNFVALVKIKDDAVKNFIIHKRTKIIYSSVFYGCENLENITIPESVVCIGISAFKECQSLQLVKFVKNTAIKTIHDEAFMDCEKLETVELPCDGNELFVGLDAFNGCYNLGRFYVKSEKYGIRAVRKVCNNLKITYWTMSVLLYAKRDDKLPLGNYWYYDKDDDIVAWTKD
ncbi:MAG: leucine-rich repeat domain-containing protein [Clostridia bacterium]|nr:leucine-rich repeat domain-containing protein [Clostridia bacterium]